MKSPTEYLANRRKSEDKVRWKDQLSPKLKALGSFKGRLGKHAEEKTPQEEEFKIVHFPDRPARRVTREEIPTEEECRAFLIGLHQRAVERQDQDEAVRSENVQDSEGRGSNIKSVLQTQMPDLRRTTVGTVDGEGIMTTRTYSPQPFIGRATEVKFKRMDTKDLGQSTIAHPRSTPVTKPVESNRSGEKQPPQRMGQRSFYGEHASPTQPVHIRQDSASNPHCQLCHLGIAEASGVCQACQEDYTLPSAAYSPPSTTRKARHSRPAAISTSISHNLDHAVFRHRAKSSLTSDPDTIVSSVRSSPYTTALSPAPPLTPLSDLSTPRVLARLESSAAKGKEQEDVLEEDWAAYYFDEENFQKVEAQMHKADGFMDRELSLDEYDKAFASPTSPGPGWI